MKKITIALVALTIASATGGVLLDMPALSQKVQASQTSVVTVSVVDTSTGRVLSTFEVSADSNNSVDIEASKLPNGYSFNDNVELTHLRQPIGNSSSITVYVVPYTAYKFNLIDSQTGQSIQQISVKLPNGHVLVGSYQLGSHIPSGYFYDGMLNCTLTREDLSSQTANDVYVTDSQFHEVKFVNVQNGKTVGSGMYKINSLPYLPGYKNLVQEHDNSADSKDYAKYVFPSHGDVVVKVRPDYSNKTIPINFINSAGEQIGTTTATLNSNEQLGDFNIPTGYHLTGPFSENGLDKGFFNFTVAKDNDNSNSVVQNTSSSYTALQSQYNDLLAKYNALNSSDVASLAKELASLKSQIATMQAEINALQHDTKTTTKQLSLTGTVTVTGTKATVYNNKFAKTGRKLNVNSKWKVFGIVVGSNGHAYFNIGGGQYIPVSAAKLHVTATKGKADTSIPVKTTATIKYKPGYSVQVWGNKFANFAKNANGSNKKLKHGTSWKVFAIVKHNGHLHYDLGGAQYLDSAYATIK